jgi:cytochrome c oxidase cbb3-type subunit 3
MPTKAEKELFQGKPTTGHEWDGIQELDTPLPKWWVYVLYACIAWAVVYFILYPSVPYFTGYFKGVLGWDSRTEVAEKIGEAKRAQSRYLDRIKTQSTDEIRREPDLLNFALAGGKAAFADNCVPCHQAGGAGHVGFFPNLADDVWIWGGKLADIEQTIRFGIRSGHEKARMNAMPNFGVDGTLKPAQIDDVAEYVLSLTGRANDPAAVERGAKIYAESDKCIACHGEKGVGYATPGAPPLNTRIFLYGGNKADIVRQVTKPQLGVMPAWTGRLDDETIKMLALYVHSLGGGK